MTTLYLRKSIGRLPWALAVCLTLTMLGLGPSANANEQNTCFTTFDVPGAGTGPNQGTEPLNINAPGDITGAYIDRNGVNHGFLRLKTGAITKFDVTGAGTGSGQGTIPICNNPADAISGFYVDANGVNHGFLRRP